MKRIDSCPTLSSLPINESERLWSLKRKRRERKKDTLTSSKTKIGPWERGRGFVHYLVLVLLSMVITRTRVCCHFPCWVEEMPPIRMSLETLGKKRLILMSTHSYLNELAQCVTLPNIRRKMDISNNWANKWVSHARDSCNSRVS